ILLVRPVVGIQSRDYHLGRINTPPFQVTLQFPASVSYVPAFAYNLSGYVARMLDSLGVIKFGSIFGNERFGLFFDLLAASFFVRQHKNYFLFIVLGVNDGLYG